MRLHDQPDRPRSIPRGDAPFMKRVFVIAFALLFIFSCTPGSSREIEESQTSNDAGRPQIKGTILLFEGNGCTQDVVGETDASVPQIANFKQTRAFENDETRSLLLTDIPSGIVIRLLDDPDGNMSDDWVEILIRQPVSDFCLSTFEQSFENQLLRVTFHHHNGLDGKVSRLEIRNAAAIAEAVTAEPESQDGQAAVAPAASQSPPPTLMVTVTATPSRPAFAIGMEMATVVAVIDGDTIEVQIDGERARVRYIGIDTPEIGQPYFEESDQANSSLVPVGSTVYLEKDVSQIDDFGRLLRYVYLPNETFVNGALVAMGMAFAKAYPPDTKHQEFLFDLEQQAKADQVGMWATILSTATPESEAPLISIVIDRACSQFDSPGDDNQTKEEEYVCIRNRGSASVDLTGWTIVDVAGHAYHFFDFTLSAGALVRVRTGCGTDTETDLYWCFRQSAIWNNGGDTASLYDDSNQLIAELSY